MAITTSRLGKLSDAHAKQRDSIISTLIKQLFGIWGQVDNFHDTDQVVSAAAASAFQVLSAQTRTRTLFRSYASTVLSDLDALAPMPARVDYYSRPNTTPLDVYQRPAEQAIYEYSQGGSFEDAFDAAENRLQLIAHDDVMLAERDEEQRVYHAMPKVVGYRRIIHPELSQSGTCGLCAVAATQRYNTDQLKALHTLCHCGSAPIVGDEDPGQVLNSEDLKQIYAAAGAANSFGASKSTAAEDLLNVRVTVDEHGEKGPVLIKHGDHFRTHTQADAPAFQKPTAQSIRTRKRAAVDQASAELADAQKALQAIQGTHTNDGTSETPREQVVLAQKVKNLTALVKSLNTQLASSDS
jgi:hypothetical protein